jgi:hypothetical protein
MATICLNPAGGTVLRATQLDECGNPTGCFIVSKCVATVETTAELIEGTELGPDSLNMDGTACFVFRTPPSIKWENYTATLNQVDPDLWNMATGATLYLNNAAPTPDVIGFENTRNMPSNANWALELWLRDVGKVCAPGETPYIYWIAPWLMQGVPGDRTVGNNVINFVVSNAISGVPSPWGVGPYNVEIDSVSGLPRPMLTPISTTAGDEGLSRQFQTILAPPPPVCGCQELEPTFDVAPLAGSAPLNVTLTFPLGADGNPILPASIDWDDTNVETVTSGVSAMHSYALAGSYTPTFTPTGYSSPTYTAAAPVVVS